MKLLMVPDGVQVATAGGAPVEVRCDGCRHWGATPSLETGGADWRFASKHDGAKHCEKLQEMVAEDYSFHATGGEATGLFTMPEFGCALFEVKA